jgi:glycosyltransferase involved in cell wall biosynthesis
MDITVIIPSYNRAWSLPKAIESCKDESSLALQIIVVDDGSTDNTWELLQQLSGVEIYKLQHWGKPWAVNMAFEKANGKYIKFLDSDDWLVAGALKKQYDVAEQEKADIVVAGYQIYDEEKYVRTQPWVACDDFIAQNLGECDSSHYSAFLFRRDFIIDIPHRTSFASANFASRDDRCFMLEAALKTPKIAVFNEPAFCHLQHKKGRLQFQKSVASACTNYQHTLIYKNILKQLADTGHLSPRRINASIKILWPLAHWVAKDFLDEGVEIADWIYQLNPDFKVPNKGPLGWMYRNLGFKHTEQLLRIRRNIVNVFQ